MNDRTGPSRIDVRLARALPVGGRGVARARVVTFLARLNGLATRPAARRRSGSRATFAIDLLPAHDRPDFGARDVLSPTGDSTCPRLAPLTTSPWRTAPPTGLGGAARGVAVRSPLNVSGERGGIHLDSAQ